MARKTKKVTILHGPQATATRRYVDPPKVPLSLSSTLATCGVAFRLSSVVSQSKEHASDLNQFLAGGNGARQAVLLSQVLSVLFFNLVHLDADHAFV
jgi:hypothetical protein